MLKEDRLAVSVDPFFGATRLLENLNGPLARFFGGNVLPDVQGLLVMALMLLQQGHRLLRHILLPQLRIAQHAIHFVFEEVQMVALMEATRAELVEELEDLVSTVFIVLDVEADEGRLDERHDFFQELALLPLYDVEVVRVGRVHELGRLILILAQLAQILLIEVIEEGLDHVFRLLELDLDLEGMIFLRYSLCSHSVVQLVEALIARGADVVVQGWPQVPRQVIE